MSGPTVVLVGQRKRVVEVAREAVRAAEGCELETLSRVDAALHRVAEGDVVLVLVHLPSEAELPEALRLSGSLRDRRIPAIFLSELDEPAWRLQLLKNGAVDCLGPPLDVSRLKFLVDLLTVRARQGARIVRSSGTVSASMSEDFLFVSPFGQRLLDRIRAIALLDTTVLLTGETGTGKTHLARVIHGLSKQRDKPFSVVHCGTLPPSLLETELFGHVRGAFTTAEADHVGRLEAAGDGTLLLDEIDCLPLECQTKLLRAVEERTFEPIGSAKPQQIGARIVAASNRCLEDEKAAGRFRADLYYRLNVVSFYLPPLRTRPEVIGPLAEKFLAEFCARNGKAMIGISGTALDALAAYAWPGNARELRNAMEQAAAFCAGPMVEVDDLPEAICEAIGVPVVRGEAVEAGGKNKLAEARVTAEKRQLEEALIQAGNNRTDAAAALGVSRVTLYKKLRRHGLS
ncbi:MAG TPA: sigma-54 dependent transcriptional regulator [Candidatus Anammoximicrobium sp.]|nr:sigma-54 dependent transcriptional regulator [Candidatus Anammoximicrobium sp.]